MIKCSNLINKNIIYNEENNNDKSNVITKISNINNFLVSNCAYIILKENKDITFDHIKYSKEKQTLYFYTDKNITISKWKEKLNTQYTLVTFKDFYEEIKNIVLLPKNENKNEISAYEIMKTIQKKYNTIQETNKKIDIKLKNEFNKQDIEYLEFNFNNNKKILSIFVKDPEIKHINLSKENNKLKIETNLKNKEIIETLNKNNELEKIFDTHIELSHFKKESSYNITNETTNFIYNIDKYGFEICSEICPFYHTKNFSVLFQANNDEIKYECDNKIKKLMYNCETPILKNIYIEIEKCPTWMQQELKEKREKELKSNKKTNIIKKLIKSKK